MRLRYQEKRTPAAVPQEPKSTHHFQDDAIAASPAAAKHFVLKAIEREDWDKEHPSVQHVRDGKPLTEHGAKLLGVEWKPGEVAGGIL